MPILEICQLKIKHHLSQIDPSLLTALQKARTGLCTRIDIDTQSRFYRCIEEPSLIYILGIWPSLERHKEFLASAHKAEILDSQDKLFDFQWIIHTEIQGGMEVILLNAPILGISRTFVEKQSVEAYQSVVDEHWSFVEQGTKPYKPFAAWRVDCEEGNFEHLMITGWKKEGDHDFSMQKMRQECLGYAAVRESRETDVKQGRDMER